MCSGPYKYMPVVIIAVRLILCEAVSPGGGGSMKNDMPIQRRKMHKKGYVKSSSGRRPNLSIVKNAGSAKTQLRMPVPIEARSAEFKLYPPSRKMLVE